jgi:transposase-like protein
MENTRLIEEEKERTRKLKKSLEQKKETTEVQRAMSYQTAALKRGITPHTIKDTAGNIVDGYHRNKIAEELGLTDIPIKQVDGTEAELQAMAIALNVARRQLDAEDRRELVAQLRAEGKSIRQIAEQLGVPKSTVADDAAEATVRNRTVDRVIGKDGKSRPARMARKPKVTPAAEAPNVAEPPVEEERASRAPNLHRSPGP